MAANRVVGFLLLFLSELVGCLTAATYKILTYRNQSSKNSHTQQITWLNSSRGLAFFTAKKLGFQVIFMPNPTQ